MRQRLFRSLLPITLVLAFATCTRSTQAAERSQASQFDRALRTPIQSVCDKPAPSPTGDARDYVSYARYWWPDPAKPDGLPYLRHDGHHNEAQVARGDLPRLSRFISTTCLLARGWSDAHRADCAKRAGDWLRVWFVDPATAMNPNLEHAQIRLGHNRNRGNSSGVLDARGLAELAAALPSLRNSPALSPSEWNAVHLWFARYFHWLMHAPNAVREHAARNNHGTWFLVQAAGIARYLGDDATARQLCEEDRARIGWQILPDGSQPLEEARQDGLGYCVFNLEAHLHLARIAAPLGIDLLHFTAPSGASLAKALDRLRPYNANPRAWTGHQRAALKPGFLDSLLALAAPPAKATP